ncbi:hypothetical protein DPMN_131681 [Dreissena polymorpha]|uniref:Uncharacterized protein n=1 Tax=Dreissena polymorpha TaxID=45954 RepID=A0A9D4J9D7_DREPO|nr:hypothetical protein DPMN_131681 [Dreissena polymorpha]
MRFNIEPNQKDTILQMAPNGGQDHCVLHVQVWRIYGLELYQFLLCFISDTEFCVLCEVCDFNQCRCKLKDWIVTL